jgi:hypothetical protein
VIGNLKNLRIASIADVNQPFVGQFVEEGHQIALTLFDFDVEGARNGVTNFANLARCSEKGPDGRPDGPEPVVDTAGQTQDDAFPAKVAGDLVLRRHYD